MPDEILKVCTTCKTGKPRAMFGAHKCRPDGLRNVCKGCASEENRRHYEKNAEALRARGRVYSAEWRSRPGNVEKYRAAVADWYTRNADSVKRRAGVWSSANADRKKEAAKRWRQDNKGRCNAYIKAYKAKKLQAMPTWANPESIRQFYELAARRTLETGVVHHVDHIVPLQGKTVCGLHVELNLRVIPAKENQAKGNRHWPDMP